MAGGIAGEPLEVVRCKAVDLAVPAHAETIIEGEVDPDLVEPEAPFGESYGFVGPMDMNPFFNIKCITHRRNPIWLATISQYPPSESTKMRQLGNQGTVYRHLRYTLGLKHVLDVAFYEEASSGRMVGIKVDGSQGADIMHTLEETARRSPFSKIIVAVDKDVNVHDIASVVLAMGMRTQPYRDYRIQKFPTPILSDYSLEPLDKLTERSLDDPDRPLLSRILIDTTMKWPWPPISLPKREFMDDAMRIWQEEGLPKLKLAEPWSGTNLGFWNDEHERHARAAIAGDYYQAGSDYERSRRAV